MVNELPMTAIPSTGSSGRRPIRLDELVARGFRLDLKLDGVRAFNRYGRLINREGVDITYRYPELDLRSDLWLDGEVVASDGSFETTLLRDQQVSAAKIKRLAEERPCTYIAFDLLDRADEGRCYADRRMDLEEIADSSPDLQITPTGTDVAFFERTRELGMEGVIAKRPTSPYRFGSRSKDWVKFKNLHRISMVAIGYRLGTGARSHFGSMKLALIGPDGPVTGPDEGWRVGSGFTEKETWELRRRMDAGDLFVVEIEVLNRTKDGALRFPVYRGIRTDLQPHQCLIDQIEALPTC